MQEIVIRHGKSLDCAGCIIACVQVSQQQWLLRRASMRQRAGGRAMCRRCILESRREPGRSLGRGRCSNSRPWKVSARVAAQTGPPAAESVRVGRRERANQPGERRREREQEKRENKRRELRAIVALGRVCVCAPGSPSAASLGVGAEKEQSENENVPPPPLRSGPPHQSTTSLTFRLIAPRFATYLPRARTSAICVHGRFSFELVHFLTLEMSPTDFLHI